MSVVVFLGPSLPTDAARELLDATYLPPARRGDIRAAVLDHDARTIVLIDGLFEQTPSVWHKEILWALDQGIPVWGASSMGALRAAELAQFGMRGHGRIFEAYRTGRFGPFDDAFEDDDEVAVIHGPDGLAHITTEAMVDMRATLAAACDAGVIDQGACDTLAGTAKGLFYKQRAWPAVLASAAGTLPDATLTRLDAWLPKGRVSQKRQDAEGLLRHLADAPRATPPPPFHFERTLLWHLTEEAWDSAPGEGR